MNNIQYKSIQKIKKITQKSKWTIEEDNVLSLSIQKYGTTWCKVAQSFPNRNPNSCIQRWKRLKSQSKIKKQKWNLIEDQLLLELVTLNGKKWKKISKYFTGKTDKQCLQRYCNIYLKYNILLKQRQIIEQNNIYQLIKIEKNISQKLITVQQYPEPKCQQITIHSRRRLNNILELYNFRFQMVKNIQKTQQKNVQHNQVKNRFYSHIISSHLNLENPYHTKLSSQQAKKALFKATLEHKQKLLLENQNLITQLLDQSHLKNYFDEDESYQVEFEEAYSNYQRLL